MYENICSSSPISDRASPFRASQGCELQSIPNRLLKTKEASYFSGLSQYELRKGAAEGRYPVILLGSPANKFRKMRWNYEMLMDAINGAMKNKEDK